MNSLSDSNHNDWTFGLERENVKNERNKLVKRFFIFMLTTLLILLFILLTLTGCAASTNRRAQVQKEEFHLYLLMGQSNMAGRGAIESIDTLVHPRVFMFDSLMKWKPAKDPLHFDKPIAGTGLGLSFGKAMANDNPKINIGLVPCSKGGSSIGN